MPRQTAAELWYAAAVSIPPPATASAASRFATAGTATDLLGAEGPLAREIERYSVRPSQLAMAGAVEGVLGTGGVLMVEAGTGTGKTLAYLVPLLRDGRRAVVSTGTLALQDQIMSHDVPLLERALGKNLNVACLKGLTNYLCLRRFEEHRMEAVAGADASERRALKVIEAWRGETQTGDRAELTDLEEDAAAWLRVRSSADTRIGSKCGHYDSCFVTQARARAQEVQIVVVNHHLYFADLASRGPHGGGFLPDHDIVVFDEAHQIEDTMTAFFGVTVSLGRMEALCRDAEKATQAETAESKGVRALAEDVLGRARDFFDAVPARSSEDGARVPLPKQAFHGLLEERMFELDTSLEHFGNKLKSLGRGDGRNEAAEHVARRAQRIRDDVAVVAEGANGKQATWSEARGRRVTVGASPIDVSQIFREEVIHRHASVVLTSATLTTSGTFNFLRTRLGVEEGAGELRVDSPFDYATQAALYVPTGAPDPRDPNFGSFAASQVLELVRAAAGGAIVLCTSLRSMEFLAKEARRSLPFPVLMQGEMPKGALLERFKASGNAVLLGAASFWQGVDVPGKALRLVIIDKLPFDVPTDPLVVARCLRLEEQGEQPFVRLLVPSAALELKQGFGRLIRGEGDRGVVAILDGRLLTKGYGKILLRSLPPAPRIGTMDEVRAFYGAAVSSAGTIAAGMPAAGTPASEIPF